MRVSGPVNWDKLERLKFTAEKDLVALLPGRVPLSCAEPERIAEQAAELAARTRRPVRRQGVVESFLQEPLLGSRDELALMFLTEAFLRNQTPRPGTA